MHTKKKKKKEREKKIISHSHEDNFEKVFIYYLYIYPRECITIETLQVDHSNNTKAGLTRWAHTLALDEISGIFCSFSVDLLVGTAPPPKKTNAKFNLVIAKFKTSFKQDSHKTMCTGNAMWYNGSDDDGVCVCVGNVQNWWMWKARVNQQTFLVRTLLCGSTLLLRQCFYKRELRVW